MILAVPKAWSCIPWNAWIEVNVNRPQMPSRRGITAWHWSSCHIIAAARDQARYWGCICLLYLFGLKQPTGGCAGICLLNLDRGTGHDQMGCACYNLVWGEGGMPRWGHPSWGMLQARQSCPAGKCFPPPTLAWRCLLAWISFFLKGCHPFLWEEIQNNMHDLPDLHWEIERGSFLGHIIPNKSHSISLACAYDIV